MKRTETRRQWFWAHWAPVSLCLIQNFRCVKRPTVIIQLEQIGQTPEFSINYSKALSFYSSFVVGCHHFWYAFFFFFFSSHVFSFVSVCFIWQWPILTSVAACARFLLLFVFCPTTSVESVRCAFRTKRVFFCFCFWVGGVIFIYI